MRHTERHTVRWIETHTQEDKKRQRETERETLRNIQRKRKKERQKETERDRDRQRVTEGDREKQRDRDNLVIVFINFDIGVHCSTGVVSAKDKRLKKLCCFREENIPFDADKEVWLSDCRF